MIFSAYGRAANARAVRFNVETKTDPRRPSDDGASAAAFARAVAEAIAAAGLEERADIQSFDFRTLIEVQATHPRIRVICLFDEMARSPAPRARTSGGFEGLAISPDGNRLYPLLEKPLAGDDPRSLLIHEFDHDSDDGRAETIGPG